VLPKFYNLQGNATMGMRGPGARPLLKLRPGWVRTADGGYEQILDPTTQHKPRGSAKESATSGAVMPWMAAGLTRSERVIVFCESFVITSGPDVGKLFKLRWWQRKFIEDVYREDAAGVRPVRSAILSLARKNGKTALAALLALCHLCGPEAEPRGECYSCANDRAQASKIFAEAEASIVQHPLLADRITISQYLKTMKDLITGSTFQALSAEAKTKMGLSPSFVVYDELGQATDRKLYDAMDSAQGARANPLMLVISTQAADDLAPMSVLVDYGKRVNAGLVDDPSFHLTLYEAPMEDDIMDPATWLKANPALDDFRSLADVKRQAEQANSMPSQENRFRNLILNQRVAAEAKFVELAKWRACNGQPAMPDGAKVFGAVDLGATRDMSALTLVWPDEDDVYHVQMHYWLPGRIIDRVEEDKVPYDVWYRAGLISNEGTSTDPKLVAHRIAELHGRYRITAIAFDAWRIAELQRELDAIGCRVLLTPHGQGYKDMNGAIDVLERLILQGRIRHGGHPVLGWNASNAVIVRNADGFRKLDKVRSTGRIDGLQALAMAFSLALIKNVKPVDVEALIG
jgi:phage terminase large subunit-like protein